MAQVKIYGNTATIQTKRDAISTAIHASVMEALSYPPEKRFHRFFALDSADFIYPDDRTENYIIIEISMFEGRSIEAKKRLIHLLFTNLREHAGIYEHDVEITLFETPKEHWGIRGLSGDELALNYKVEV